ncbi:MAG: alkaline phosphatase family protein [Vicinamibacterales bacterium]
MKLLPACAVLSVIVCAASAPGCGRATRGAGVRTQPPPTATAVSPQRQHWLDMFARGYFPGRSGQLFIVPKEGDFITERDPLYGFMHGSPWDYDTRIPILFHGAPFVKAGDWKDAAAQQDIAPTIGALIGAPPPATYTGRPLANAISTTKGRPRVVTVIVMDAMRAEYFDRYAADMPALTRMRREGAWFSEARANVLPTVTGVGHATIGTGTDPRIHGITVNNLFNRATGKVQPAYEALDPRELMALTLGDSWNLATNGAAVIIGQGGAIRATAGLVGRGSCLVGAKTVMAASYGGANGGWETNPDCYTMPEALKPFVGRQVWEAAGGRWLGHDIASASKFRASSLYQKFEAEAAMAVVNASSAGADEITDLIFINLKGPDYVGHMHGPDSEELRQTLAELDRQMAAYLALIEKKAGAGRSVTVVTADHGTPGGPGPWRRHHTDDIIPLVNQRFDPEGRIIQYYGDAANNQLFIDTDRLRSLGFTLKDVAAMLEGIDFLAAAFTEDEVRAAQARLPR